MVYKLHHISFQVEFKWRWDELKVGYLKSNLVVSVSPVSIHTRLDFTAVVGHENDSWQGSPYTD